MIIMQKKKHDQIRIRDSLKDLHLEIQKQNKLKTPKELGMDERFEDVSTELSERDKDYGRVFKKPTEILKGSVNSIYNTNNGE
jgi:DNA-directed RNA polymerase specialized sigma subunit